MSIEQKIAELLEDSIRLKNLNLQEADQDEEDQDDDEVVVIKKIIKKDDDQDEDELDEDLSADEYNKKIGAKSTSKKAKPEVKLPEQEEGLTADEYNKKIKGVKEEFDVQEDVDALLFGEDLSEEFREKASVIFEAAVMARVKSEVTSLEEAYQEKLTEEVQSIHEELEEKVNDYLGYIAEQWLRDNKLAVQQSLKSEILEGFVEGMKTLFQEHYIDVPDEQFDAVGDLHEQISHLETKLDETLASNVEMRTQISTMIRENLVEDFCKELTDTEVEKFKSLSEELIYSSEESFISKLEIIKENYFSKNTGRSAVSVVSDKPVQLTEDLTHVDQNVARYLDTFNRIKI